MLFSCLVDADFLATERFMSPQKATERPVHHLPLESLSECLGRYLAELNANCATGVVNEVRHEVLQNCRDAANLPPGLFSLTVPTGGGKTLSSLVFALSHAQLHNLRRIVVAIPFTSIIEQTADVYRNVFVPLGSDVILEHHSNLDPERETPQSRLAAENWDAPIVVTTNVQLFESLFAAKTSRCRKLHNLVGSVIILDEAQTLPVEFLRPCLAALRELAVDYRCSIVLCTATQPALDWREQFPVGLKGIREIIPRPQVIAERMRRVQAAYLGDRTDEQLVDEMSSHASFLAIVNTRPHAARLYKLLIAAGSDPAHTFHLSTNLCGSHRAKIITKIRQRLASGQSCRVVSTQLIEAGVDVDFPVVYRAVSGVDSMAQAAGRCNREGRLTCGTVYIFNPADVRLIGYLRSTAETTKELLPDFADLLDSAAIRRYFELHYWKQAGDNHWDGHRIMECFPTPPGKLYFQYKTAADAFRLIDTVGKPVLVPYGKGEKLIEQLRKIGPHRDLLRKLQRYTVNVFEQVYNSMLGRDIELLDSGFAVLINSTCYDKVLGFCADRAGDHDPQDLVI
jgi:CRISPR-associated endonuclease/helicase Cas3